MTDEIWQACVVVPPQAIAAFDEALNEAPGMEALASSSFEIQGGEVEGGALWKIEVLFAPPVDQLVLEARVALAASSMDMAVPGLSLVALPDRDWVTHALHALPPVHAGRFFVHGAHDRGKSPAGAMALEVEAGRAFGNGKHETTYGCLLALDRLGKVRKFQRPLDLGCGAGVLALAMARLWRVPVVASDIDPWAVAVTRENSRGNHLHPWIKGVLADGFAHPALSSRAPYDLIVANILARPLQRLAPAIAAHLAPGGRVVLSGLLAKQDAQVRSIYRDQGLFLRRRRQIGEWITLELDHIRRT
ncbi:MAG: 50S ribosomal protein L11 methyltransferase [Rhodospirillaceae bacterium]|jgi:ribosomal protein L11 methyltransferase|nr:50S ribosomal protein L11 methyltransferase [Rhodospirillaceae bacterium]MBT4690834.1 50S ribosomal protein L11 methyltransferase [Rhodospirillaceae bacterium]MBT5081585.1 50S ribosomal protein L11 methyltransferase [Rhodospirillaceae bacterium]MBT5527027.1 50S ribosomal protein L11 methyltransferase [Rhodospirillaceae bacterium]MBT5881923.1 50S ribosomal protein L11 methyltransferase [Rhodospirillaceae bacterium]